MLGRLRISASRSGHLGFARTQPRLGVGFALGLAACVTSPPAGACGEGAPARRPVAASPGRASRSTRFALCRPDDSKR